MAREGPSALVRTNRSWLAAGMSPSTTQRGAPAYRTDSFEHRGHRLVYDVYGAEDGGGFDRGGRVIVYLHGLLLDSELNRGIAQALADHGSSVVLLDLLGHGRSDRPAHASEYRIDSYAEQVIALLDHLGVEQAALGGLSLGANASLFAATAHPDRIRGLVLEMPVMEWAVPAAAMLFVPMLLGAHYGRPVLGALTSLVGRVPRTPFGPLNSFLDAGSMPPEIISAVLHGVLVGPVVPTQEQRGRDRGADPRARPFERSHPSVQRCAQPGGPAPRRTPGAGTLPRGAPVAARSPHRGDQRLPRGPLGRRQVDDGRRSVAGAAAAARSLSAARTSSQGPSVPGR